MSAYLFPLLALSFMVVVSVLRSRSARAGGGGQARLSSGAAWERASADLELLRRLKRMADEGKKIQAIRDLRVAVPGIGLADAKDIVESIDQVMAKAERANAQIADSEPADTGAAPGSSGHQRQRSLADRVREMRDKGQETYAIRLVCDETGMGIIDAQKFVRSLS